MKNGWYSITNKGGKKGRIDLYDDIGMWFGKTAKDFNKDLKSLGDVTDIDLHLNSNGGSVFDGFAIFEMLRSHAANVTVYVDGIAASIASVIAMAGNKIIMAENAFMMMHNSHGIVIGESRDMEHMADLLNKINDKIIATYMKRSKIEEAELRALVNDELWLTSDEALEMGFADEISGAIEAAAFSGKNFKAFAKVPAGLATLAGIAARGEESKPPQIAAEGNDEMTPEEIQALVEQATAAAVAAAVAPVQARAEAAEAAAAEARQQAAEARSAAGDLAATSRETLVRNRLDAAVRNQLMTPQERDSAAILLSTITDNTKADEFLSSIEKRTPVASHRRLTQQVTARNGETRNVEIGRNFTIPVGENGVQGPNPQALAVYEEATKDAKDFKTFRANAYRLAGEELPGLGSTPWDQQ